VKDDSIQTGTISVGGVSPIPLYLKNTSTYLSGKAVTAETMKHAAELAVNEISPISDIRGSAAYKTLLLRQLVYAHFLTLFPEKKLEEGLL
jgi:xanthine dehydrogenase small subunit